MFVGNFHGFNTYDIENPKKPKLLASVVCPGGQGDVSVYGNLLFMSVEQTRGRIDCGMQGVADTGQQGTLPRRAHLRHQRHEEAEAGRGGADLPRLAHAHAGADPKDKANIYVYGSGTGAVRSGEELDGCSGGEPKEDPNTALFSIDVIEVPLAAPENAKIVNRPRIFADAKTGNIAGLWPGGDHGPGTQKTSDDQPVPRHHGVPGSRPGGRRVLGQRHPDGHLAIRCIRSGSITSPTRTSPTGTRRRSTTTAPR